MSKSERELITELKAVLSSRRYSPVVIGNYCAYAQEFLDYLMQRGILVVDVTEAEVARYLCHAVALFRKRRSRNPGKRWHDPAVAHAAAFLTRHLTHLDQEAVRA